MHFHLDKGVLMGCNGILIGYELSFSRFIMGQIWNGNYCIPTHIPIATGISRKMQVWIGLAMNWNNHLTKRLCISSIKGKSVSSSTCNNHIINQIKRIDCNIFPVVTWGLATQMTWLPHVLWPFKPWNGHLHTSKRSLWTWAKHQPRSISLIATGSGTCQGMTMIQFWK